jgi:hypothetical protein
VAGNDHEGQNLAGGEIVGQIIDQCAATGVLIKKGSVDGIESDDGSRARLLIRQRSN